MSRRMCVFLEPRAPTNSAEPIIRKISPGETGATLLHSDVPRTMMVQNPPLTQPATLHPAPSPLPRIERPRGFMRFRLPKRKPGPLSGPRGTVSAHSMALGQCGLWRALANGPWGKRTGNKTVAASRKRVYISCAEGMG